MGDYRKYGKGDCGDEIELDKSEICLVESV